MIMNATTTPQLLHYNWGELMRLIGKRIQKGISYITDEASIKSAMSFNDGLQKLPTGNTTFIKKGVYHFKTHEEANKHWFTSVAKGIANPV
jgi:hypothetical protein